MKPTTRSSLKTLLNKVVAFKGWTTSYRHDATWVCIQNAYVIEWDMDSSVQEMVVKPGGLKFDHLWLSSDLGESKRQKNLLYKETGGVGIVRKYKRSDGSFDYTVKSNDRYDLHELYEDLNRMITNGVSDKELLLHINEALRRIENQGKNDKYVYSISNSLSKTKAELVARKNELEGYIKSSQEKLQTATNNGPCKNLELVKFKSKRLTQSKGF